MVVTLYYMQIISIIVNIGQFFLYADITLSLVLF